MQAELNMSALPLHTKSSNMKELRTEERKEERTEERKQTVSGSGDRDKCDLQPFSDRLHWLCCGYTSEK